MVEVVTHLVEVQGEIIDHLLPKEKDSARLKGTGSKADGNVITENENGYDFYWPEEELHGNITAAGESQKAAEEQKHEALPNDLPGSHGPGGYSGAVLSRRLPYRTSRLALDALLLPDPFAFKVILIPKKSLNFWTSCDPP